MRRRAPGRFLDRAGRERTVDIASLQEAAMDGRWRVAVVEDDGDIRDLVVELLSGLGFDAVGYADGGRALEALRRPGPTPSVILLDLEMPGMTGWEFRREQLRDPRLAAIPVVVASAADRSSIEADAFLSKPYETAQLCDVLARLTLRGAGDGAHPPSAHAASA
jgi:CheY-like chemotaxis protein